jgi:hypothetical protein
MKLASLLLTLVLLSGCATALKREGQCLASLTPDYLHAQEELQRLEQAWRAAMIGPQAVSSDPVLRQSARSVESRSGEVVASRASHLALDEARGRLLDARARHRATLDWYEKVYARVRVRLEEEEMLSDTRMVLGIGAALIFHPIVRWNLRSVLWEGLDPDSQADPVTRFCQERLARDQARLGSGEGPGAVE